MAQGASIEVPEFLKDVAYRSDRSYEKKATTAGNRVNITFFNNGLLGGLGEVRGEWPRGSLNNYIGDVLPVIVMEVPVDTNNDGVADSLFKRGISVRGPRAGASPRPGQLKYYGFEPMAGFANNDGVNEKPAISTEPETWPEFWPDQPNWVDAGTGNAEWNGFFGRDIQNSDFETYFYMDDHNDETLFELFGFLPDSTDATRKGQGLAMSVRGLQWSQFLAQDAVYWIYELTNTGTTTYNRVAVGLTVGTLAGGDGDSQDDMAFFDQSNRIVYSWDFDNRGNRGQQVGYVGYAFMESPGNPFDGIDNDGDGDPTKLNVDGFPFVTPGTEGVGNVFTLTDFPEYTNPISGGRVIASGDPIILIDEDTYKRTIVYMPNRDTTVISQGITYNLSVGTTLRENQIVIQGQVDAVTVTEKNLIDDDLDGLIDEDYFLHFTRRQQDINGNIITLPALRYINYVGFAQATRGGTPTALDSLTHGLKNTMIDESAYDGIDNDGDWNPLTDDTGRDGRSGTGDEGEGDGKPTPGEPSFELLDVDETDQVGLSSFYYFTPPGAVRMDRDQTMWDGLTPGFFTTNRELQTQQAQGGIDGDFIFGSGYFRLEPGQKMRFSMALVFGENLDNITKNVQTVQEIYNRNYNFAKPPDKPSLSAFASDNKVVLYWNDIAERSLDPILGYDFEGYKIYRSTDPFFLDPSRVTDYSGNEAVLVPIVQFDLVNGIKGVWKPVEDTSSTSTPSYAVNPDLLDRTRGVPFYLGSDIGIKHSYVDTTVVNGQIYYYAIVAYDRGSRDFYPAENNFALTVSEDGRIIKDINVVEVKPNAGVSGYTVGGVSGNIEAGSSNTATGEIMVEVLNPTMVPDQGNYRIEFDRGVADTVFEYNSSTFTVKLGTETLLSQIPVTGAEGAIFDGMRLILQNDVTAFNPQEFTWNGENANISDKVSVRVREGTLNNSPSWLLISKVVPFDYEIEFTSTIVDTSIAGRVGSRFQAPNLTAIPTYFKVKNITENRQVDFGFRERRSSTQNGEASPDSVGRLDSFDFIYIFETINNVREIVAEVSLVYNDKFLPDGTIIQIPDGTLPVTGDKLTIVHNKTFRSNDFFTFSTDTSSVDSEMAKSELDKIKVVPNPYLAAASWESKLPPTITSGRGERRIDFIHIPANSIIRIFSVRGELVKELRHTGNMNDGTVSWNLRTRENLETAYGVYFYHVEAPGLGNKTGKFAIIK